MAYQYSNINAFADWIGMGTDERNREFSSAEAAANREWQEQMSNTAHQREVADLKAAGINPVLTATGGNGATTPSGASAAAPGANTPGVQIMAQAVSMIINSAAKLANSINDKPNNMGFGR